ncbi:glycoside hydrolase domain-containing protein [Isoptericola sp. BMS4]|uniref:glycoside hydrolase domain-containing protein n=1 Tax=Isoptericola sp. BMS4 TaxID=2527875 RepID=UPI00196A9B02|nr:glycoside hydrolase domain-containing protein [Isoptericola sp. BMS4]
MRALIRPAAGPADPPSSAPRAGVLRGTVFAYRFHPSDGVARLDLPGFADVPLGPDDVLDWAFYADDAHAVTAPYASLAVAVDVRLDDGSRLSDVEPVRDRYDVPLTAEAQFAARWSMPEQWNADSVGLAPVAGRRGTLEVVLGDASVAHVTTQVTGFVEVRLRRRPASRDLPPAERVDTRRGTHSGPRFSRGNTVPAVAVPHGFTFLVPATDASDARWPYRPFVHDDAAGRRLEALQFSHQPSPWIGDRGVLQLMPYLGGPRAGREERRRWIVPGTERARPHGWSAELGDGLSVEMTTTDRVGAFRVGSRAPGAGIGFVLDQLTDDGALWFTADGGFEGWVPEGDPAWGNAPRTYVAGRVVGGARAWGAVPGAPRPAVTGHVGGDTSVEVRVAISFLSIDQAWRSLEAEAPGTVGFDALRDASRRAWDDVCGRVTIPELPEAERPYRGLADAEHRARIASALYRLHLYPNRAEENAGTAARPAWRYADPMVPAGPHGDRATGAPVRDGRLTVNNGYWDTYRTVWPLLALLDRESTGSLLDGLLGQYRGGGFMARWSAPGYVDSMVGTSSDQIVADAERWGVPFGAAEAFESGVENACRPAPDALRGRKGLARGRFTGYIASSVPEGLSWSVENAVSDAALARMADRLADDAGPAAAARYDAFARYLGNRSRAYRGLFDARTGFLRGRDDAGRFAPGDFDPRVWGGDYVETNAWGLSVGAVHDGAGLAGLFGGRAALGDHLDRLFAQPETADPAFAGSYGTVIHEQREARALRSGMCAVSNQPAHHIPAMYVHSDRPWRAGQVTRDLAGRLFAGAMIGQGFPGDEDNGEMSAWWLWAALGLYPLELASGRLLVGVPLYDDVTVRTAHGRVRVRTRRETPASDVLAGVRVNGTGRAEAVLTPEDLAGDVDVELDLAEAPAADLWPTIAALPWHPELTDSAELVAHDDVAAPACLADDGRSGTDVALRAGEWVGWRWPEPVRVTDVAVTSPVELDSTDLVWETSVDGRTWRRVATSHDERLAGDRTTPFRLAHPVPVVAVRVGARRAVTLRQVELFALD